MKIVVYVLNTLSSGKRMAAVGHVCKELGRMYKSNVNDDVIIVLSLSKTKLDALCNKFDGLNPLYMHVEIGINGVDAGTLTAVGFIDYERQKRDSNPVSLDAQAASQNA